MPKKFSPTAPSSSDRSAAAASVDPVITLTVRAHDLGIPTLDAEVPVHIYTEDMFSRTMRFIIPRPQQQVERDKEQIRWAFALSRLRSNWPKFLDLRCCEQVFVLLAQAYWA